MTQRQTPGWRGSGRPGAVVSARERWRSGIGALLGIALTGSVSLLLLPSGSAALWLIAPMGASAVLLFAVPSSPLAQPASVIGGNLIAAVIGVTCARYIGVPLAAASVAVAVSIAAMIALRCLHPPSGAVALTAVLGGPEIHQAGYAFVLAPVLLNSLLMLTAAVLYNRAVGRRYPHGPQRVAESGEAQPASASVAGGRFSRADVQAAMRAHDEVLDVSLEDLESLVLSTERQALRRRRGELPCSAVMTADVPAVEFATELAEAWALMARRSMPALPVVDRARRVIGIVTRADILREADLRTEPGLAARLRALLRRTPHSHADKPEVVGQIMSTPVHTLPASAPAVDLVPLMADRGCRQVPIVDAERRLAGMVRQVDLIGALYALALDTSATPSTPVHRVPG